MKSPEQVRRDQAHEENAQSQSDDVVGGMQIELSDTANKNVADGQIEESPQHVHDRR
jgi:hypothetical protein